MTYLINKKLNNAIFTRVIFKYLDVVVVFLLALLFFDFAVNHLVGDFIAHLEIAQKIKDGKIFTPNFLFYGLVNIFSFDFISAKRVIIVMLAFAISLKYYLTKNYLDNCSVKVSIIVTLALMVAFSIPDYYNHFILDFMYLGRFPPNVWHNSTTIFVFPFSLWLFYEQIGLFVKKKINCMHIFMVSILVLCNLLIKPSFIISYIPATSVFLLFLYFKNRSEFSRYLISSVPVIIALLILFLQYFALYEMKTDEGEVVIAPLKVLRNFIPYWYMPISLCISYILPIYAIIFYRHILKEVTFIYAIILTAFALAAMILLSETGARQFHGNFFWQVFICGYILQLVVVKFFLQIFKSKAKFSKKLFVGFSIFFLQVVSGVFYLVRYLSTGSYY